VLVLVVLEFSGSVRACFRRRLRNAELANTFRGTSFAVFVSVVDVEVDDVDNGEDGADDDDSWIIGSIANRNNIRMDDTLK
jgi:hypothetical protein